ncbi:MAG: nuclear transport factor 2 family protein [Acidobacteriaceae bacterium]|nr:nuclear transport factor 2 family protein [Acidobacteriaceae bacterium]
MIKIKEPMHLRPSILRRVVLLSIACGLFATIAVPAQTNIGSETENQLQEAERQWQSASADNNIPAMLRIVTQNFAFVNTAGEVLGWEQWLTSVRKLTPEAVEQRKTSLTATNRDLQMVQLLGDTAIVSYRLTTLQDYRHARPTFGCVWVASGGLLTSKSAKSNLCCRAPFNSIGSIWAQLIMRTKHKNWLCGHEIQHFRKLTSTVAQRSGINRFLEISVPLLVWFAGHFKRSRQISRHYQTTIPVGS